MTELEAEYEDYVGFQSVVVGELLVRDRSGFYLEKGGLPIVRGIKFGYRHLLLFLWLDAGNLDGDYLGLCRLGGVQRECDRHIQLFHVPLVFHCCDDTQILRQLNIIRFPFYYLHVCGECLDLDQGNSMHGLQTLRRLERVQDTFDPILRGERGIRYEPSTRHSYSRDLLFLEHTTSPGGEELFIGYIREDQELHGPGDFL